MRVVGANLREAELLGEGSPNQPDAARRGQVKELIRCAAHLFGERAADAEVGDDFEP